MLMQSAVAANETKDDDEEQQGPQGAVDKDTCEKQLVQLVTSYIWNDHGRGPVDVWHFQRAVMRHTDSAGGLSIAELRGMLAEVPFDLQTNKTLIPPVDHIRAWVPLHYQMKETGLYYQAFLQGELFPYIPKVDIGPLNQAYPLFPLESSAAS
ncbi:hypothetical protein Pmar_PMAR025880 [Perkinsus marinus ATCC 50983]|uniref:Uncharacterized protein n=1 Tax=Perkinsus marinus (strain ATCC 50983 / TXsc) TaxID=423536 RepID=C5LUZ0_PERM5|nr:hypothetical protein Pmar_PMAR025880 [Perkinsus marinus ATCC 50983]EEQ99490.1 hypothetical protein Pmar_PMAR025880 [Perkinsus marinus ATCC 50983]|eukprot:XP_002766773.1 hypothetical protein Pmar_PMAR025880 [Perkinsus marinus ATCC 50983]